MDSDSDSGRDKTVMKTGQATRSGTVKGQGQENDRGYVRYRNCKRGRDRNR
jgi:hypothetical protein